MAGGRRARTGSCIDPFLMEKAVRCCSSCAACFARDICMLAIHEENGFKVRKR